MTIEFGLIIRVITIILLVLMLIKQYKIKNAYKYNGYVPHRRGFILMTYFALYYAVASLILVANHFEEFDTMFSTFEKIIYYGISVGLLFAAIFGNLWFRGSTLKFLKKSEWENFLK